MTDDQRWAQSEPRLVELMRAEILASPAGHVTFARFMECALTAPGLGYYATSRARPTRQGDFLTAPESHPFFGRCLGRELTRQWDRLGRPARFVVREFGAGAGTLARDIRDGLRADRSGLAEALEHQAVDLGLEAPPELVVGCILANEFLDALPVHRVVWRDGRLQERYVTWRDGWFGDDFDEPSTPDLAAHLLADGVALADGQAADICLAATDWMRAAAGALDRGSVVVIDYGHEAAESYGPRRMAGTLLGYRRHQVQEDPYAGVGRTDLTAHVDLTAIARAAADAGLTARAPTTLGAFVVELGLGDLLSALGRDPATPPEDYLLARSVVARMLDPRHLGAQRVAIFERHR